jgi:hypothetical protein
MQLRGKGLTRLIGSYLTSVACMHKKEDYTTETLLKKISASGRSVPSLPSLLSHAANIQQVSVLQQ